MGRPPSSGGPAFRFLQAEVAEMEAHLQQLNNAIPHRTVIQAFVDKFTASAARAGKISVQYKQVWNWFQNRRYSQRSRTTRGPPAPQGKMLSAGADEQLAGSFRAQPSASARSGSPSGKNSLEGGQVEFEAKSARDGAWYDVAAFLSHRLFETGDPGLLACRQLLWSLRSVREHCCWEALLQCYRYTRICGRYPLSGKNSWIKSCYPIRL